MEVKQGVGVARPLRKDTNSNMSHVKLHAELNRCCLWHSLSQSFTNDLSEKEFNSGIYFDFNWTEIFVCSKHIGMRLQILWVAMFNQPTSC